MKRPPGVKQEKQRPPGLKQEKHRPLGVKQETQRPAKVRVAERRLLDKILEDKVLKISNEAGNSFCYCNAPSSKNLIGTGDLYYGFLFIRVRKSRSREMVGDGWLSSEMGD